MENMPSPTLYANKLLLAANALSPDAAVKGCPFQFSPNFPNFPVFSSKLAENRRKLPRTGSPRMKTISKSGATHRASQKPSLSGLVKRSFQEWQPSVVL